MKTSLLTLTVLLTLASAHPSRHPTANGATPPAARACLQCDEFVPSEGHLLSAGKLRLGKPVEFDDGVGINGGRCFPLFDGGELLTWLHSYHQVGPRIFLRRCVEHPSLKNVAAGSKGGAVEDVFDELRLGGGKAGAQFVKLEPPLWSEFSNPSFCGPYLAYWGTEFKENAPVKVFAVVFDLSTGEVIRRDAVGSIQIESDSRSLFARPRWGAGAKTVTFDPGTEGHADAGVPGLHTVTLQLK